MQRVKKATIKIPEITELIHATAKKRVKVTTLPQLLTILDIADILYSYDEELTQYISEAYNAILNLLPKNGCLNAVSTLVMYACFKEMLRKKYRGKYVEVSDEYDTKIVKKLKPIADALFGVAKSDRDYAYYAALLAASYKVHNIRATPKDLTDVYYDFEVHYDSDLSDLYDHVEYVLKDIVSHFAYSCIVYAESVNCLRRPAVRCALECLPYSVHEKIVHYIHYFLQRLP